MVTITLSDKVAEKLEAIARQQNRDINEVAEAIIESYEPEVAAVGVDDLITSIMGIFDDSVTDLSMTSRETLKKIYQEKYGHSD